MSQASRTWLTLVVLLGVGLGLGLYAWKGVYEPDEKQSKQKDVDERLFSPLKVDEKGADGAVAAVEFVKLRLTQGDEVTVLERDLGKGWKMTAPIAPEPPSRTQLDLVIELDRTVLVPCASRILASAAADPARPPPCPVPIRHRSLLI